MYALLAECFIFLRRMVWLCYPYISVYLWYDIFIKYILYYSVSIYRVPYTNFFMWWHFMYNTRFFCTVHIWKFTVLKCTDIFGITTVPTLITLHFTTYHLNIWVVERKHSNWFLCKETEDQKTWFSGTFPAVAVCTLLAQCNFEGTAT